MDNVLIRAGYEDKKSSLGSFAKCALMNLLVRGVEKNRVPGQWAVRVNGDLIGFITTTYLRKNSGFTATTIGGFELDNCNTFMCALARFLPTAEYFLSFRGVNKGVIEKGTFCHAEEVPVEFIGNRFYLKDGSWDDISDLDFSLYPAMGWLKLEAP